MSRYPHYIDRAAGGRWPSRVICVACTSRSVQTGVAVRRENESLVSWHAVCLQLGASEYRIAAILSGGMSSSFWSYLKNIAAIGGSLWLISHRCGRVWSLLRLWEALEEGRVYLDRADEGRDSDCVGGLPDVQRAGVRNGIRQSAGSVSRLHTNAGGYLVCEDPPNIACLRAAGWRAGATWVDVRNYGCDTGCLQCGGVSEANAIADWIRQLRREEAAVHLGSLKSTAGSQAMHCWRHHYLNTGVYCHVSGPAQQLEHESHVGGRCEAFRLGPCPSGATHVDIRSAYGYVCKVTPVAVRLRAHVLDHNRAAAAVRRDPTICVARVRLQADEPAYPYRWGDIVIWPVGRFTTTLAGPELADAVASDAVQDVEECSVYDCEKALAEYSRAMYDMRCRAERRQDKHLAALAKRLLVSLPGKLGQRERRWVTVPDEPAPSPYGSWWGSDPAGVPCRYRSIAGMVQRDEVLGYSADACVSAASCVTSAGRMLLLKYIRIAGWENVYYIDTDSLIVSEEGYLALESAGLIRDCEMGYLQLRNRATITDVRGIKYYVEDGLVTCAGLPHRICEDVGDGEHYWVTDRPGWQASKGERPTAGRRLRTYERTQPYRHGLVRADGRVDPIQLMEW